MIKQLLFIDSSKKNKTGQLIANVKKAFWRPSNEERRKNEKIISLYFICNI